MQNDELVTRILHKRRYIQRFKNKLLKIFIKIQEFYVLVARLEYQILIALWDIV